MTETETPAAPQGLHAQEAQLSDGHAEPAGASTGDPLDGNESFSREATPPGLPDGAIRHSCGAWWTGTRVAHCGGCHRSFSSTTAFDQHQRGGEPGTLCRDPEQVGLVPVAKPYGVLWSWPDDGRNPHAKAAEA